MTHALTDYEVAAIKLMVPQANFDNNLVDNLDRDFTGHGYYCNFSRPDFFPKDRRTISDKKIIGHTKTGSIVGFVLFCDELKVTLEVFPYDDVAITPAVMDDGLTVTYDAMPN